MVRAALFLGLAACAPARPAGQAQDLAGAPVLNRFAHIPASCYVNALGPGGDSHNSCYVCHTQGRAPNPIDDADLQLSRDLPDGARINPWLNLLGPEPEVDRARLAAFVRTDNYRDAEGEIALAAALRSPPPGWDADGDGRWGGPVPDLGFNVDAQGWDHDATGALTGWRAYRSAPLPGVFLPVNGGAGDLFLRLPEPFRETAEGEPSVEVYSVNLTIALALVRRADLALPAVDERALAYDLDGDGLLGTATLVRYRDRAGGDALRYVGGAAEIDETAPGLLPEGAELAHSVRYLDLGPDGAPRLAPRMRELRTLRKVAWLPYAELAARGTAELAEDRDDGDAPRRISGDLERGLSNGLGWRISGFIEDSSGALRPQTVEETLWCVGCHGGVGATTDATFSLTRFLGWGHPEEIAPLDADPKRADGVGEYATWIAENHALDELRTLPVDPSIIPDEFAMLGALVPDADRVWQLNARLEAVMRAQTYNLGREPARAPEGALLTRVAPQEETGIGRVVSAPWIRP